MATAQVVGSLQDRSVKVLGPEGAPRRKRFSQETARLFLARKIITVVRWDRRRERILCVQFDGESRAKPNRWLKCGTRYSHRERVNDRLEWAHKALPNSAMRAQLGEIEPQEVVDMHVRALFTAVQLSILRTESEKPKCQSKATVVSIEIGRRTPVKERFALGAFQMAA